MKVLSRICSENYTIVDDEKVLNLRRGKEYITSPEKDGRVTVFSTFWATGVPVTIFAGEKPL